MDIGSAPSAHIRRIVGDALSETGMGQRRLEAAMSLPRWALRGLMDPARRQSPSVDRAAEICRALGYELVIRPRDERLEQVADDLGPEGVIPDNTLPPQAPGASLAPVSDPRLAEILAAFADEWDELNARGREALAIRVWTLLPELRERERRLARVVAWLGWRVVEGGR